MLHDERAVILVDGHVRTVPTRQRCSLNDRRECGNEVFISRVENVASLRGFVAFFPDPPKEKFIKELWHRRTRHNKYGLPIWLHKLTVAFNAMISLSLGSIPFKDANKSAGKQLPSLGTAIRRSPATANITNTLLGFKGMINAIAKLMTTKTL